MKWPKLPSSLTPPVVPSCLSNERATIAAPRLRNVSSPISHPCAVAPGCTDQHVFAYVEVGNA